MEFLRTPDPAASGAAARAAAADKPVNGTPALDRSAIKSSFQQLFTPNPGATNALLSAGLTPMPGAPPPASTVLPASGLTPFLGGGATPYLLPMPPGERTGATPDIMMSSPYLQAAAKEAVRREFMNMPTYITGVGPVPIGSPSSQQQKQLVYTKDGRPVPENAASSASNGDLASDLHTTRPKSPQSKTNESEARVPTDSASQDGSTKASGESTDSEPGKVPDSSEPAKPNVAPHPPFAGRPPFFVPPGMMMVPPQMFAGGAPPPNAVFVHPGNGMMMFAPGMAPMAPPGMPMMMMAPMAPNSAGAPNAAARPNKPETADERKSRIEREKQELIREFKKKTREAALVRFRQKRRERRFGKLIRYECRKQLADARPRVKGRFVRIRNDPTPTNSSENSESAQVVPRLE